MTSHLWKFYLEEDVESFVRVLDEAGRGGRQHPQKGHGGGQNITPNAIVGSPPSQLSSSYKQQRSDSTTLHNLDPITREELNQRDAKGLTLLHHVASSLEKSALAFAHALLGHPAVDIYLQDWESGWTALHRAFYFGNIGIAHAILERETQNVLNQTSTSASQLPSLKKIKDREGHGPYDILTSTIKDRTLTHEVNDHRHLLFTGAEDADEEVHADDDMDSDYNARTNISALFNVNGDEALNFGTNKNSSLGFGDGDDRQFPEHVTLKRPRHLFQRFYSEHLTERLAACASHTASEENIQAQLQLARGGARPPYHILAKPIVIVDVQMAKFHTAVLTDDPESNLYICGHGLGGRLGTGDEKTQSTFTCIQDSAILHKKVIAIALGQDHTCAVMSDGSLFTWGSNKYGQLGSGIRRSGQGSQEERVLVPKQLFGIVKREMILGVAASRIHSVAHTATSLFTWGKNEGQLGAVTSRAAELEVVDAPRKVAASRFSSPIRSIAAIERATCVLLESREVHVLANYGVVKVNFPTDGFAHPLLRASSMATRHDETRNQICKITCSGDNICALSSAGEIFKVTVDQCVDPSSSKSTTNPNKIRAALSAPQIIWGLRKGYMSARDVSLDQDGSIVLTTEAGTVWRQTLRAKATASMTSSSASKKEYKFSRVPGLSRIMAVRASGSGSYSAIRRDCDVTRTQMLARKPTLWDNLFDFVPIDPAAKAADLGPDLDAQTLTFSRTHLSDLTRLCVRLRHSTDPEKDIAQNLRDASINGFSSPNVKLISSVSNISIPAHAFVLAARSRILREAFAAARRDGNWSNDVLSITFTAKRTLECTFHGLDTLSLFEIMLWSYTDEFVGFWQMASRRPSMAYRYRQIRTEVMKIAGHLEMKNLEAAMRRMVPLGEKSLDKDLAAALLDPAFMDDADAVVELSDGELLIHSGIFSKRSPFFDGLFVGQSLGGWVLDRREQLAGTTEMIPVDMKHVEQRVFALVLRHVYSDADVEMFDDIAADDADEFLDLVLEVLSVANELMMDRLSTICQKVIGRFVTVRNVCQLLNAISPCSMTDFKDAALEYLCLNLETMLSTRLIDELDPDLFEDLDEIVKQNQLNAMPYAKSRHAELRLFDRHPQLAERIDRDRRARIDAFSVRMKYGGSLDLGDEESFLRNSTPRRHRAAAHKSPLPGSTPSGNQKPPVGSVSPLLPAMDRDRRRSLSHEPLVASPPSSSFKRPEPYLSSPRSPDTTLNDGVRSSDMVGSFISPHGNASRSPVIAANQAPSSPMMRPWGENTMPTAKLGIKEMLDQASSSRMSGLSLGLAAQGDESGSRPNSSTFVTSKMSQKERKKMQQEQSKITRTPSTPVSTDNTASSPSPWRTVSSGSRQSTPRAFATSPSAPTPVEPSRSQTAPHMTMRQTIAHAPASKPTSKKETDSHEPPRTPSRPSQPQQRPPSTPSNPTPPVQKPHPSNSSHGPPKPPPIQSIRHQPPPSSRSVSDSLAGYSIADIVAQQQAEKKDIQDAVAARSLQDVMIEQEFQQWWDQESRRVAEQQALQSGGGSSASGRTRGQKGRRGRGRGKDKEKERTAAPKAP